MPERRHVRRVARAGVLHHQRRETFLHALLFLVGERGLAAKISLVPFDEALEPALQDGVVGGKLLLPGSIALFQPERIQREHAEGFQPVCLAGRPDRVEDCGGILDPGVQFPAEFAGE